MTNVEFSFPLVDIRYFIIWSTLQLYQDHMEDLPLSIIQVMKELDTDDIHQFMQTITAVAQDIINEMILKSNACND